LSARSPSLPDRLHQRRGNFEQAGTKPIASDHAEAPKIRWRNVAVRCKLLCSRSPLVRPMLSTRSPIFVAAGLVLLVAVAAAQPSTTPMKMLDDVRDRRYCELFVVKREAVRLAADVYNTLGLNDCPQAAWDAIDTAKVASQFGAFRVIRNGPVTLLGALLTFRAWPCGPSRLCACGYSTLSRSELSTSSGPSTGRQTGPFWQATGVRVSQPEGSGLCDAVVFANRGPKSCLRRSRRARKSSQTA